MPRGTGGNSSLRRAVAQPAVSKRAISNPDSHRALDELPELLPVLLRHLDELHSDSKPRCAGHHLAARPQLEIPYPEGNPDRRSFGQRVGHLQEAPSLAEIGSSGADGNRLAGGINLHGVGALHS